MNVDHRKQKLMKSWSREYKKGFSAYFLLLFMKDEPTYGFELSRRLQAVSHNLPFNESGIYQQLKKLENADLIHSEWRRSDQGPRRKYYQLTSQGNELLAEFTQTMVMPLVLALGRLIQFHFPALAASFVAIAQAGHDRGTDTPSATTAK